MRVRIALTKAVLLGGVAILPLAVVLWRAAADEPAAKPANKLTAADPGTLTTLSFDTGGSSTDGLTLAGRDARRQLLVSGTYSTGQTRDLTRSVSYSVDPATIASVDSTGLVLPLAEGQATITAKDAGGPSATVKLTVSHLGQRLADQLPESGRPGLHQALLQ